MIIVHLALASDWDAAWPSGEYRVSTIGATLDEVGFIHASTDEQLAATFERFYAGVDEDLVMVVMDTELAGESGAPVVFEDAGNGELFPHIFGPIRPSCVLRSDRVSVDELAATLGSAT